LPERQQHYLGRTHLQKILYFLKVLNVPMGYHFEIYHYGPFCEEILRDIDILIADEVIIDHSPDPKRYSNYFTSANAQAMSAQFTQSLSQAGKVSTLVKAFVRVAPGMLELISTLDYLFRWQKASGGNGPWKEQVVAHLNKIKPNKFNPQEVDAAYKWLVDSYLIEP